MIMYSPGISETESTIYRIFLNNEVQELEKLSDWLNIFAEKLSISSQVVFRLDLILSESVVNIIENAYEDKETHQIKVELQYINNRVNLRVEDDGKPFNPLENPEVEFADNLEDATIGGLGIHLIRSYSDECYYQRQDGKNVLDIVIYH